MFMFYDNSILLGTKMVEMILRQAVGFYDNSILLGTKICEKRGIFMSSFTITQFF